jgi:AcrR family transcriptional regulator
VNEFARGGIDGTSLDRIAKSAGLTKGAIFSNFASKNDLVFAVLDEYGVTLNVETFLDSSLTFEEQLRELGREAARIGKGASRRLLLLDRALQMHILKNPAAMRRYRASVRAANEGGGAWLDQSAAERGLKLPVPGPQYVAIISAFVRGMLESALHDPKLLDEEYFADAFGLLAASVDLTEAANAPGT